MNIQDIFSLLGGLALFLYGMMMMSNGLEDAAGNKMKQILEKLTSNRFLGVAVGAGITAIIQSSSATTVMVVGFVNSGMMTLRQAVWIIMGANIGTTITGQLIALDIGVLAPLIAFIGVFIVTFIKSQKAGYVGQIFAGLGVLFIGMGMMGDAMKPLQDSERFVSLMTTFSNPVLGILAGMIFTAIIQSSSASVGILQTLATNGLIAFPSAVFVLFGQNIGTCITAVLASIGTNRNAKRTTVIHLLFNLIGTAIFTVVCILTPLEQLIEGLTPGRPAAQIANMHTLFNITTTLLLLPLGGYLANLAEKILPDKKEMDTEIRKSALDFDYLTKNKKLGLTAIHMDQLKQEIEYMLQLAKTNVTRCYNAILEKSIDELQESEKIEHELDVLNKDISQYISKILVYDKTGADVASIEQYFSITGNIERIGDHAINIAGYVNVITDKDISFSEQAQEEIGKMQTISDEALGMLVSRDDDTAVWLSRIAAMEQKIDDMTKNYRENHLERMRQGKCSEEACILFSEMLTDFERIGDHILNIGQAYAKIAMVA